MSTALGLAFLTGMLATVNPCGFAMLPTYLAYFIGSDSRPGRARPLWAGLRAGVALSAGFTAVFVTAGLLVAVGLRSVAAVLPWAAVVIGAVIVLAGAGMLVGWQVPGTRVNVARFLPSRRDGGGLMAVFGYGVAYAVAALSCSLALLLAVVAQAVSAGSLVGLLAVFAAYAAGSAVVLVLLSLGASLARDALARHVRRLVPFMGRIGGAALVLAGTYLLLYWVPALSGGQAGGALGSVVTDASVAVSGFITASWPVLTAAAGAAVIIAVIASWRRRGPGQARPPMTPQEHPDDHDGPSSCCLPGASAAEVPSDRDDQAGIR